MTTPRGLVFRIELNVIITRFPLESFSNNVSPVIRLGEMGEALQRDFAGVLFGRNFAGERRKYSRRLIAERLEDRTLLNSYTWSGASGMWSDAANWVFT